jgi:hypothetical protein
MGRSNPIHSLWMINAIRNNNGINPFNTSYVKGKFYSKKNKRYIYYDSSYELLAYNILEQLSQVISYSRCDFYIEYEWKDHIHRYIPDIKVVYKSGDVDIIEVKPLSFLLHTGIIRTKGKMADKYCKEKGWNYKVWTENVLKV